MYLYVFWSRKEPPIKDVRTAAYKERGVSHLMSTYSLIPLHSFTCLFMFLAAVLFYSYL